jgi:ssDNA-binding Zn-finger/Zn-ribbon topoisomerase 1
MAQCPKCHGDMVSGRIWDARTQRLLWSQGHTLPDENVKLLPPGLEWSAPTYRVVAHRCDRCGLVEIYAPEREP